MKLRKVFSGFDGMQGGRLALMDAGVEFEEYYASEIDKHAVEQSSKMFPDTIHMGDITKWREWQVDWSKFDLFMFGSPCQGFSRAGKGLNFEHPGSKLFFVCVDILEHIRKFNPNIMFFMENVDMDKWCLGVISRYLGVYPVNINSNLVSAQNRNRWYWTNISTKEVGMFNEIHTDIPQPEDQKIYLKDILEPEESIPEKYYIKNIKVGFDPMDVIGKGNTLRASGSSSQSNKHNYDLIKIDRKGNFKNNQDKASTLTVGGNSGGNHSDMDLFCVRMVGRKIVDGKRADNDDTVPTVQRLEPVKEVGKTNCLTTVEKDNLIFVGAVKGDQLEHGNSRDFPQGNRVYHEEGKGACLNAQGGGVGGGGGLVMVSNKDNVVGGIKNGKFVTKGPFMQGYSVKDVYGKAHCLLGKCGGIGDKTGLYIIGGIKDGSFELGGTHSQAARVYSIEAKSASLCALGGGGGGKTGLYLTQKPRGHNKGGDHFDKTPTLTGNSWEHNNHLNVEYKIRRLTPREASRLQTVPEWYKWYVSDTQIYRMCGNGWTIKVISHIFKFIKNKHNQTCIIT